MIQRIQTIYLIFAIATVVAFLFAPVIQFEAPEVKYIRNMPAWDVKFYFKGYYYFIVLIAESFAIGLSLLSIFLFKRRAVQALLCLVAIVFHVLAFAYIVYYFRTKETPIDIIFTYWNIAAIPPVIFWLLAYRGIKKDDELIKSMERLRD
ncbi:MAG: DUF4293 domain-containing protein [Chitinophagales bacterium]|nr:DUF4293 domain-containing protein [Chitinophagales bacterium]MDW8274489.1 DUF4293 domain-containing protein [Chitinophagales bacterium]